MKFRRVLLGAFVVCTASHGQAARAAGDGTLCQQAISAEEHHVRPLPTGLLEAIGLAESGHTDPLTGHIAPWPWTINVAGQGHYFSSKDEAVAAVAAARIAGVQSIDVGCEQINLLYHPQAFASLEEAFDPGMNVAYAAAFLISLHAEKGDWPHAAAAYHSQTEALAEAYGRRVMLLWPQAGQYGGDAFVATAVPDDDPMRRIDPQGIFTPAFRQRLLDAQVDRAALVRRGILPAAAVTVTRSETKRGFRLYAKLGR